MLKAGCPARSSWTGHPKCNVVRLYLNFQPVEFHVSLDSGGEIYKAFQRNMKKPFNSAISRSSREKTVERLYSFLIPTETCLSVDVLEAEYR